MTYLNNDMKFVCVVNRKIPVSTLMNALAHTVNGLAISARMQAAVFLEYPNKADNFVSTISESPYIILMAKNSSQLRALRAASAENGINHNAFISAMIGPDADAQKEQTLKADGDKLEYWAVALYGQKDDLQPLTKRFSLYRPPS